MVENISAVLDEDRHARLKRAIANAYAMTSIVEFEPLVDSTSRSFMSAIGKRFADTGLECHLGEWLQMYAFDIMYGSVSAKSRLLLTFHKRRTHVQQAVRVYQRGSRLGEHDVSHGESHGLHWNGKRDPAPFMYTF